MQLSIGMIVKNEEKYLRRCLTAIQPILNSISSELIIVDTGSTDKTVEIAKEFTDKVYFFEWINDFAAARNYGLERAKGEWFMFLDADEIFLSCNGIIRFFKSGEYKKYNSATYAIRNYRSEDNENDFSVFNAPRLTKILPETKFIYPIHEQFSTFNNPIKAILDPVGHYGYVFNDTIELMAEKFKRNAELLLSQLEIEQSPMLYLQLFDTFSIQSDKSISLDYLNKGIELCKEQESDFIFTIYHSLIGFYYSEKQYEELLQSCDEYFSIDMKIRQCDRSTDCEIYCYKALTLQLLERYEEAADCFSNYFSFYQRVVSGNLCTNDYYTRSNNFINEVNYAKMHVKYTECCLKCGRYKDAEKDIKSFPANKFNTKYYSTVRIMQEFEVMSNIGYKEVAKLYEGHDSEYKAIFFDVLRYTIAKSDDTDRRNIINKMSTIDLEPDVCRYLFAIYKAHYTGAGAGASRINMLIDKYGTNYPEVLYIALNEGIDITPFVNDSNTLAKNIETAFENIPDFAFKVGEYSADNISSEGLVGAAKMYYYCIFRAIDKGIMADGLLQKLGDISIKYFSVYGEQGQIPEEVYSGAVIAEINMLRSLKKYKECVDSLRRLIKINSAYAPIATEYQKILKADVSQKQ